MADGTQDDGNRPRGQLCFTRPASGSGLLVLGDTAGDAAPRRITGLVFSRPASGSAKLTFGKWTQGGSVTIPPADLGIDAGFTGDAAARIELAAIESARLGIDAGFGGDAAAHITLQAAAQALIDTGFAGDLPADASLVWDANVSRGGLRHELPQHWQSGQRQHAGAAAHWQQSQPLPVAAAARWHNSQRQHTAAAAHWQDTLRQRAAAAIHWQAADPRRAAARQHWQDTLRQRAAAAIHWQAADPRRAAARQHWQDMLRQRAAIAAHWQDGQGARASTRAPYGDGQPRRAPLRPHWQAAWRPRAGLSHLPAPPTGPPPCYDPARLGLLVFDTPASASAKLVFVCHRTGPGPGPGPAQWVIPVLDVYMTTHSLSAALLPSLEPVALLGATIDSSDDGFGWSLQASGPEHLLDQLAPVSGLPARVLVTIDGHDWVFAIERIARTRSFGQHRASIQGRSTTALLGAPYMPEQSWLNGLQITAQQAIVGALEYTDTALDWDIDDWTLPAGTWSMRGTPLQAAVRVAEAAGAVLRSHPTEQKLIVAPRYPVLPWDWSAAAPTVQMPADIITTDDLQPEPRAAYNAIYVSGMAGGVLGHVRRAASAGDLLAPQVTDALITHEVAARMRGSAELAAAGAKLLHTMTLPLLTDTWSPGPVLPGWLMHVDDIGHTWRGLVRSIRIDAGMTVVRQTIQVERAAA